MRIPFVFRVMALSALLWGGASLAARQVRDFEPPAAMSEAEVEAAKAKARNGNMNPYAQDVQIKPKPVPWMAIGLGGLVLLVAVPFAVRAYLSTTKEMAAANTFGLNRGGEE